MWYLFVFKRNIKTGGQNYRNYMTGELVDTPIFSHKLLVVTCVKFYFSYFDYTIHAIYISNM